MKIVSLNAKNIFSTLLVLKDEPDDLTHLAPTAGDACIPLDETTPFFSDMFDDFIIPDNYNALLSDELNSLDSSCSKTTSSSSSNDPFINYRDDSNDICHSPHLLSPGLSKVKKRTRCGREFNDLLHPLAKKELIKYEQPSHR